MDGICTNNNITLKIMELKQLRDQWEKGMTIKSEMKNNWGTFLVILFDDRNALYHTHRYFRLHGEWQVSVDNQDVNLDKVFEWLSETV